MTDAEVIRKQAEKILELEEEEKILRKGLIDLSDYYSEKSIELSNANDKLEKIKEQVEQYQFDSATNLQNKIKTILMSSTETAEHQD